MKTDKKFYSIPVGLEESIPVVVVSTPKEPETKESHSTTGKQTNVSVVPTGGANATPIKQLQSPKAEETTSRVEPSWIDQLTGDLKNTSGLCPCRHSNGRLCQRTSGHPGFCEHAEKSDLLTWSWGNRSPNCLHTYTVTDKVPRGMTPAISSVGKN